MATVNFLLTSPIAVDCDMDVAEIKVVSRVNELFQELQRIPGVRVAMSDIGYADGMDYCAIVSVKNQWYASAAQLRRVAEQFDPQYKDREYDDVRYMEYYTDLSHLEQVKISGFRINCNELVYRTTEGRDLIENALGVELVRLPAGENIDYYNQYNSLFRVRVEQFNGTLKYGYIDKYGMPVMKTVYDEISAPDKKGLCCASFLGKKGIVAAGDGRLIPFVYNDIKGANLDLLKDPQCLDKGMASRGSLFSENGHILAEKMTDDGLRWGVIDRKNKVVIPFEFETLNEVYTDDARYAKHGLLIAQKDGKFGMIDKDGSVAVPFEYDYLGLYDRDNSQLGPVGDGYLFAYKDTKVGIIDVNNKVAMPLSLPQKSDIYRCPEERVGVYITPQERVNTLIEKIRDAETVRSEISHYSYHDACVAALEEGFFNPDEGEFNRDKERRLAEIGREIETLYEQLDSAEANVRKFAPPLERRTNELVPTSALHNIEQGIREKLSNVVSPQNCEQKM